MNNDNEIIRLLKYGQSSQIQKYLSEKKKTDYSQDFPSFIDQIIQREKISRKSIALKTGLSQDYLYKLLRGDKRTTSRDYILAICFALKMNLPETQHTLKIYGMPILDDSDLRSHVIILAIQEHMDIDETNEWLEKAGYTCLRTSPDMPSAPIEPSGDFSKETVSDIDSHVFTEVDFHVEAEKCGLAPFDYTYWGVACVEDENGNRFYIESAYSEEFSNFIVLDQRNKDKADAWMQTDMLSESDVETLEQYEVFEDTVSSPFFKFFLLLDREIDKKVIETLETVNDTRNYGMRIGCKINGKEGIVKYAEMFNIRNPAEREYYQVIEYENHTVYSASHESYFMRLELDDGFYSAYFGEASEPEYYIYINSYDELPTGKEYLKFYYRELQLFLHQQLQQQFNSSEYSLIDERNTQQEYVDILFDRATALMHNGDNESAKQMLLEALSLMNDRQDDDTQIIRTITYWKLGNLCTEEAEALSWFEKTSEQKDYLLSLSDEKPSGFSSAVSCTAHALVIKAQTLYDQGRMKEALDVSLDVVSLLEGNCSTIDDWENYCHSLAKAAYAIDETNPELAASYTEKAIEAVRDHQLDQSPSFHKAAVNLYNNHAWVLWNRLGQEEAIYYYLRGIELVERYNATHEEEPDWINANLEHMGKALFNLYIAANRNREADRLRNRLLEKYSIEI